MKAATIHEHGGPDCVRVEDIGSPKPSPNDALLEVRAAGLNHLDIWVRNGRRGRQHGRADANHRLGGAS